MTESQLALYVPPGNESIVAAARQSTTSALESRAPAIIAPATFRPFTGAALEWATKIAATDVFKNNFPGADVEMGWVSIGTLLTYQPWLTRVHAMMPMAEEQLLEWCLPLEFTTHVNCSIAKPSPNEWDILYETADPTALFGVAPINGGLLIGGQPRCNWVQVASTKERSLIVNGNHRVALLASQGITEIPAVHRKIASLAEAIPKEPGWFTPDQVHAERPPRAIDFLDAALALDAPKGHQRRVMQLSVKMSEHRMP